MKSPRRRSYAYLLVRPVGLSAWKVAVGSKPLLTSVPEEFGTYIDAFASLFLYMFGHFKLDDPLQDLAALKA